MIESAVSAKKVMPMFLLMFAAIGGGLATVSLLAPLGLIPAALAAPLGGSLCAVLGAVHLSRRHDAGEIAQAELDAQTDDMVKALRGLAAQGKEPAAHPDRNTADVKAA